MWYVTGAVMKNSPPIDRPPVLRLTSTPLERILLFVAPGGIVCSVAPLALSWSALPEIVPSHCGASGRPNAYGSKMWLLLLPALSVIPTITVTILARYPTGIWRKQHGISSTAWSDWCLELCFLGGA